MKVSELSLRGVSGSKCGLGSSLLFSTSPVTEDRDSRGGALRFLEYKLSPTVIHRTNSRDFPASAIGRPAARPHIAQRFNDQDLVCIALPARSAESALCFSLTPQVSYFFTNPTADPVTATLVLETSISIDSAVLANPLLLDKATARPFGGSLTLERVTAHYVSKTLPANSSEGQTAQYSEESISGLISTRTLQVTHGLSCSQAQDVLRSAMTVRFSTGTTVMNHLWITTGLGVELFGD
jgi:hypothetical protein